MAVFQLDTSNGPDIAGLEEYLRYFVLERVTEVEIKLLREDAEYQQFQQQFDRFLQDLQQVLPEMGAASVLEAIRETTALLVATAGKRFFTQGFQDGAGRGC